MFTSSRSGKDRFVDLPPTADGQDPARGGTLWHLAHAGVLHRETTLNVWKTHDGAHATWHLSGSCPDQPAPPPTPRVVTVEKVLAAVTAVDGREASAVLCECERRTLLDRLALDAASVSVLRFLCDTDALPTSPEAARMLRTRLRSQPAASSVPALDVRARARADLRWRQLNEAMTDRGFQAVACHQVVERLRLRTTPMPALWTEACQTWVSAYRADMDDPRTGAGLRVGRDASYESSRRGKVHDLVWEALTGTRAWIRSGPPADSIGELGCVFAEDETHTFLLVPAAGVENAQVLLFDDGYDAEDVAAAAELRPGAPAEELGRLVGALAAARAT